MIIYRVVDESGNGYKKSLDSDILNWSNEGSSILDLKTYQDQMKDFRS